MSKDHIISFCKGTTDEKGKKVRQRDNVSEPNLLKVFGAYLGA